MHVGQSDTACAEARAALGPAAIVGVSAQTVAEALAAQAAGADYLGVGAMYGTPTKPDAVDVTLRGARAHLRCRGHPGDGHGGINARTMGSARRDGC